MMSSKLVPELRFKEFSGEWEEKKLGEIATNIMYGMNASAIKYDGYHKYIRITDIDEKSRNFLPNPLTSPDGLIDKKFKLIENDILFARTGASVGKSYIYKKYDGDLYFAGFLIKFNINNAVADFIFLYTLKSFYKDWVSIMSIRSGQPGINAEEYKLLKLHLPPTPQEQQKIANTFSSLDNLIEAQTKKVELLKSHKKGLMQKLFPRDGAKVPEVRFKEFSGEWEEKTINQLFKYKNGGSFEKNIIDNGIYNLITLNSIDINGELKNEHKTINIQSDFLNKDDLVMVLSDVAHGNFLGLTAIIPESNKYVLNQRMGALKSKTNDIITFIRFYINNNQKYFKIHGHGSSQQNLSKNDILKFKIFLPTPQEQQKIADTLSSLDNLIEAQNKKIELLKEHKKGLMQKMFVGDK